MGEAIKTRRGEVIVVTALTYYNEGEEFVDVTGGWI